MNLDRLPVQAVLIESVQGEGLTTIDPTAGVTEATLRARQGYKWLKHAEGVLAAWVADMDAAAL